MRGLLWSSSRRTCFSTAEAKWQEDFFLKTHNSFRFDVVGQLFSALWGRSSGFMQGKLPGHVLYVFRFMNISRLYSSDLVSKVASCHVLYSFFIVSVMLSTTRQCTSFAKDQLTTWLIFFIFYFVVKMFYIDEMSVSITRSLSVLLCVQKTCCLFIY